MVKRLKITLEQVDNGWVIFFNHNFGTNDGTSSERTFVIQQNKYNQKEVLDFVGDFWEEFYKKHYLNH